MARIRRRGVITRGGRRSILLGVLASPSTTPSRTGRRSTESRVTTNTDRA